MPMAGLSPACSACSVGSRRTASEARSASDYTANLTRKVKVLDFVKFGGPECTVLRTFRWEVSL